MDKLNHKLPNSNWSFDDDSVTISEPSKDPYHRREGQDYLP